MSEGEGLPERIVECDLFGSGSGRPVSEGRPRSFRWEGSRAEQQTGILAEAPIGRGVGGRWGRTVWFV